MAAAVEGAAEREGAPLYPLLPEGSDTGLYAAKQEEEEDDDDDEDEEDEEAAEGGGAAAGAAHPSPRYATRHPRSHSHPHATANGASSGGGSSGVYPSKQKLPLLGALLRRHVPYGDWVAGVVVGTVGLVSSSLPLFYVLSCLSSL